MAAELLRLRYHSFYNMRPEVVSSIHAPARYNLEQDSIYDNQPISRLMKFLANDRWIAQAVVEKRSAYLEGAWRELLVPLGNWRELPCGEIQREHNP